MLQAIIKKGKVIADNVPAPEVSKGCLLIKVVYSCISAGTEISGVNASGKSLFEKVLENPGNIKKAIDKARKEGISKVANIVKNNLSEQENVFPTGYSISGYVIELGENVEGFRIGDRVAAAGAGYANHAEFVCVPVNLVVKIPEQLGFDKASTVTLGSIALQGIRRAELRLGEFGVVFGAGILGLLTIQMLKSSGVRVAAIDIDNSRLLIASEYGAELVINPMIDDPVDMVENWSGAFGVDAVLFTATTSNSLPLSQSFKMCKKKGRLVLVGVSGMEINREDIYQKELDFLISTSYGPGRYDKQYEEKGLIYPYAYVRWTENRNLSEYLRLVAIGSIMLDKLINAVFPIAEVDRAFESFSTNEQKPLMVLLDYGLPKAETLIDLAKHDRKLTLNYNFINKAIFNVALVGVGNFAKAVHLPVLEKLKNKFRIYAVMSQTGLKAKMVAEKYQAQYSTTNYDDILNDKNIDLVIICTRHDSHAKLVLQALEAGKNVFVEKPLATSKEDLDKIEAFFTREQVPSYTLPLLMVGFNRRFSIYAREIKKHVEKRINPLVIHYRMNAGYIPLDSWVHEYGGRIVGEACHLIDLMTYITGSTIVSISCESLTPATNKYSGSDNKAIILKYKDGSVCSIDYFAIGSKDLEKEFMEIHFDNRSITLDDYKLLKGYNVNIDEIKSANPEKGHKEEFEEVYKVLKFQMGKFPIEIFEILETTKASFLINEL